MKKFCPNCEEGLKISDSAMGRCNGCGWSGPLVEAATEPKLPATLPKLPYVSIDIETTGLDSDACQTLEIGAVIDDWIRPLDQLPVFRRVLAWEEVTGSPYAMSLNAGLLKLIGNKPQEKATCPCVALNTWIEKCGIVKKDIPFDNLLKVFDDEPIAWYDIPNHLLSVASKHPKRSGWEASRPEHPVSATTMNYRAASPIGSRCKDSTH